MTKAVSMFPEDMTEGVLPWADKNQRCVGARVITVEYIPGSAQGEGIKAIPWNSEGQSNPTGIGLEIRMKDDEGNEALQFISAGGRDRLVPSMDGDKPADVGEYIIPRVDGSNAQMGKNSNLGILLTELINAGYPRNRMEETGWNFRQVFEGMYGFVVAHNVETVGKKKKAIPLWQSFIELPGGKKGAKRPAASEEEPSEEDVEKAVKRLVKLLKAEMEELKEKDKDLEMPLTKFAEIVNEQWEGEDFLNATAAEIFKGGFKKALGKAGYTIEDGVVKPEED